MTEELEKEFTEEMLGGLEHAAACESPAAWLGGYGRIKVKDRSKGEGGLVWLRDVGLGYLQRQLCDVAQWCLANGKPVRVLLYKKRQTGASTGSVGLLSWFAKRFNVDGLIVGGASEQSDNLWQILKVFETWDQAPMGTVATVKETYATYSNGSRLTKASMLSHEPGRSRTVTFLLATEVARWAEEGVKNASDVLTGLSNSVPNVPLSVVIWESTVRGGSGAFFEKWQGAVDFEDFKAGIEGNGYVKIFEPWFLGFDSEMPVTPAEEADILAGRGAADAEEQAIERDLLHTYRLRPGHIKFWRRALDDCLGDPDQRDRDFPTTPEHGFRASVPGRFNPKALKLMKVEAERCERTEMRPIFISRPEPRRFVCEPRERLEEAAWMRFEEPIEGARYILAVDPMRGIEDGERAGRDKRDTHGVVVLRLGHFDGATKIWRPDKVAACSKPLTRWPITELAEQTFRLSKYYGNCLMVPEANFDSGLILKLREWGANIYEREKPPTDKDAGEKTGKFGFLTRGQEGEGTRRAIIENLADSIRHWNKEGRGIEVSALHIADELEFFIIKDGKEQALPGKHDDHVIALAMAHALKAGATRYAVGRETMPPPPDVALVRRQHAGGKARTHRR